ncbi:MAG TPA: hypothetical protein VL995_11710 [Cellvibrio sp.]|nr:hypothetical protein [Cellvibrio sp.]
MGNMIASVIILLVPLIVVCLLIRFCWQQGWSARLAMVIGAALVSLHTHAHYFPTEPLKDRYAKIISVSTKW